ncbi:hypothetical protein FVEG_01767 [Fusarium verticillioides 7600]|uniref:Uncharacterized protein n=1 Tax=Gibberella moniliformis (strain M3125 / FGSC 7600) TaxID=334819 RepID=W7LJ68_GIBM7|nr:hypothetical protein FVEG_01767 [Fusarium verticillioides 7600]EWG38576.1 hypothetical protein FVEG_01767 [Fusarium verticillioides 7600]
MSARTMLALLKLAVSPVENSFIDRYTQACDADEIEEARALSDKFSTLLSTLEETYLIVWLHHLRFSKHYCKTFIPYCAPKNFSFLFKR